MSHLSYEQRILIQQYLYNDDSIRYQYEVAERVHISPSCLSKELSWFKTEWILYCAKKAHERAKNKRAKANKILHTKITKDSDLAGYIWEKVQEYRSPEQIVGVWKTKNKWSLSHNTVYAYLDEQHPWRRKKYARHKGKKRKKSWASASKIPDRVWIEERPKIVDEKLRMWDFEGDTIVWDNKSDCIVTIIDRVSLYAYAKVVKLEKWESLSVVVSTFIAEILSWVREEIRKTLTLDNGTEFADHEYITTRTWVKVYFANPYHSRERWCNENYNGLLRQYYPKWMSFENITQEELDYHVQLINNRPRKKLWRKSPTDVFLP